LSLRFGRKACLGVSAHEVDSGRLRCLPHRFCSRPFGGDFYINSRSQILIAAIFALSLTCWWFWRMTSLGHASYLGVAAYISAL